MTNTTFTIVFDTESVAWKRSALSSSLLILPSEGWHSSITCSLSSDVREKKAISDADIKPESHSNKTAAHKTHPPAKAGATIVASVNRNAQRHKHESESKIQVLVKQSRTANHPPRLQKGLQLAGLSPPAHLPASPPPHSAVAA